MTARDVPAGEGAGVADFPEDFVAAASVVVHTCLACRRDFRAGSQRPPVCRVCIETQAAKTAAEDRERARTFWPRMFVRARCGCVARDCATHGAYDTRDHDRLDACDWGNADEPAPKDGDNLTPEQIAAGWHYCPEFDYLLTQGEGDGPECVCGRRAAPSPAATSSPPTAPPECCDPSAPVATCTGCGCPVPTCERIEPVDGSYLCPAHGEGAEVGPGLWFCSSECHDAWQVGKVEALLESALALPYSGIADGVAQLIAQRDAALRPTAMPGREELGRVAYDTRHENTGFRDTWADLAPSVHEAWCRAAEAVKAAVRDAAPDPLGLLRLAADQAQWSQATFGTDKERGPLGALRHLEEEAREAQAALTDRTEYADCLLLILDAARRAGMSACDLVAEASRKMTVNRARTWPKPVDDTPVEHVKDAPPHGHADAPAPGVPIPACANCGEPAACFGAYEGVEPERYSCGACCGHGCEDGYCVQVGPTEPPIAAKADRDWAYATEPNDYCGTCRTCRLPFSGPKRAVVMRTCRACATLMAPAPPPPAVDPEGRPSLAALGEGLAMCLRIREPLSPFGETECLALLDIAEAALALCDSMHVGRRGYIPTMDALRDAAAKVRP